MRFAKLSDAANAPLFVDPERVSRVSPHGGRGDGSNVYVDGTPIRVLEDPEEAALKIECVWKPPREVPPTRMPSRGRPAVERGSWGASAGTVLLVLCGLAGGHLLYRLLSTVLGN